MLQPGQPFPSPAGLHDLDLLSATLVPDEAFTIPDSGGKNVVLITDGAANVGRPGGEAVVLLAGEAASFSGELQVAPAPDGGEAQNMSFVVAMIGPEVPPLAGIAETATPPAATAETPAPPAKRRRRQLHRRRPRQKRRRRKGRERSPSRSIPARPA